MANLELGRTETVRWHIDGFEETGVLIYPPGFKQGDKIPLVLNIHGGPNGASTEAFAWFDEIFAAQGWAVFKPNYRGSNTQGDAFQHAIVNDLGEGPGRDVMAGIAAVKTRGFVDTDRIAVSGWSYGGYMTAWLIGHYQGWSAAVIGSPITNYLDWYDLSCCSVWGGSHVRRVAMAARQLLEVLAVLSGAPMSKRQRCCLRTREIPRFPSRNPIISTMR